MRRRWSHRTHRLCCTQATTVERRSGRSVGDLAARPQGSVGDVLRAPGGGIVAPCRVLPAADRREAREASAMGRRIRRPLLGTTSIRPAYSRRRRPAEAIESLRNSWEPIDARAGRVQEDRSLCIWWDLLQTGDLSQKTSSSTTAICSPTSSIRLVWQLIWPVGVLRPSTSKKPR